MAKENLKIMREKFLSDCPPDKAFWTCNGTVLRNLRELRTLLNALNDNAFKYHVNTENKKNDFANWINDVIGDRELARQLNGVLDRHKYLEVIDRRIKQLGAA
jgi:hypothetical protein